jgi:ribosomal protein L14E/L6E/L27E
LKATVGDSTSSLVKALNDEIANRTTGDEQLDSRISAITNTTIPGLETRIEANKTAAANAHAAANTAQSEVDALEGVVEALTQTVANNKTAAETAVSNEKTERETADAALNDAIEALRTAVGNVSNIMNFRGAFASKTEVEDPQAGDVIVITSGDEKGKEFVYSDEAWVEFGSVDAQQTAIDGLLGRMTTAEGKIVSLETNSATKSELNSAKGALQDAIDLKAAQADLNAVDGRVGALETVVGNKNNTGLVADVSALKSTVGDASNGLVKNVTDLQTASAKHAEKTWVEGQISNVTALVTDEEERATKAEGALGVRIDNAVTAHGELVTRVGTAETNITNLQTSVNGIIKDTLPTLAKDADLDSLEARVATIEGDYLREADTFILDCGNHTV